ncbi:hypothetical protein EYF80_033068 [Liparis tanakae]|uniref:Uncharacterized protein n=1 Tax=Liparis tanakae TaxID=230148 RepID=A0A4Z2GVF8_9TELE|nr:hypothetical protein EYF80_033068 [Liparis tanakae]
MAKSCSWRARRLSNSCKTREMSEQEISTAQLHLLLLLVQLKVAVLGLNLLCCLQQLQGETRESDQRLHVNAAFAMLPGEDAGVLYTSMLRLYRLCRCVFATECSDSSCGGSLQLMKELKDFKVVSTVVSSSKSISFLSHWCPDARTESSEQQLYALDIRRLIQSDLQHK